MKYLVLAAMVLVGCGAQAESALPELRVQAIKDRYGDEISADCHAKWLPEYTLVLSCLEQQAEGAEEVGRLAARIRPGTKEETIMRWCAKEALDRTEPDIPMVAGCYNKYKEDLKELSSAT